MDRLAEGADQWEPVGIGLVLGCLGAASQPCLEKRYVFQQHTENVIIDRVSVVCICVCVCVILCVCDMQVLGQVGRRRLPSVEKATKIKIK